MVIVPVVCFLGSVFRTDGLNDCCVLKTKKILWRFLSFRSDLAIVGLHGRKTRENRFDLHYFLSVAVSWLSLQRKKSLSHKISSNIAFSVYYDN